MSHPQITGQCHCGAIAFASSGPIVHQGTCTCRACQQATGTLGSPNIGVPADSVTLTKGTPAEYKAEGEGCDAGTWQFCGQCGSPLYWKNAKETEVALFVGALDDPTVFHPPKT